MKRCVCGHFKAEHDVYRREGEYLPCKRCDCIIYQEAPEEGIK